MKSFITPSKKELIGLIRTSLIPKGFVDYSNNLNVNKTHTTLIYLEKDENNFVEIIVEDEMYTINWLSGGCFKFIGELDNFNEHTCNLVINRYLK